MPNITITNSDSGSVVVELGGTQDGLLLNAEAAEVTFVAGTLLSQTGADFVVFAGVAGPVFVLTYDVVAPASGNVGITALSAGRVNVNRLVVHDVDPPVPLTPAYLSQLRDYSIIPVDVEQLGAIDNQVVV